MAARTLDLSCPRCRDDVLVDVGREHKLCSQVERQATWQASQDTRRDIQKMYIYHGANSIGNNKEYPSFGASFTLLEEDILGVGSNEKR